MTQMTEKQDTNKEILKLHSAYQIAESFSRCTRNGFVACNLNGEITYVNKTMEELTGWHEAELIGKDITELYALPEGVLNTTDVDDALSQPAILYTRDEKKLTFPVRQTSIKKEGSEDEIDGYLTLFITNTSDVDRAQTEFVSTVSHELRTPITSIKGFASTLLHHRQKLDEEKRKKYISIIKDQAERLSRLVEDLLAVSRLESKKLQFTIQPLDIKKSIDNCVTVVQSKHNDSHTISMTTQDPLPPVWADADRLEQILTNLIDNAMKYSPEADKVDLDISVINPGENSEMMQVNITDYGIGIDQGDIDSIFGKFSRLDSPLTRTTEGTGLGLYITKSLACMLNGDVKVKSEKEKQTTFSLLLPTSPPSNKE